MIDFNDPLLAVGEPDEVAIDYVKASDFRTVWADGVIGSPTATGYLSFAFYVERPAIPRRQVHKIVLDKNELGPPLPDKTISRGSTIREMSMDILMSPEVAERMATFLQEQVMLLRKMQGLTK